MRNEGRAVGLAVALGLLLASALPSAAQQTVGVFLNDEEQASGGYTLVPTRNHIQTYLVDQGGLLVNSWSGTFSGLVADLLPDGHMMRGAITAPHDNFLNVNGGTGRLEEYDWYGNLVWEFDLSDADYRLHHDFEPLPNGNVLGIVWVYKTDVEAIAAGRDPATLAVTTLIPERIVEIQPTPPSGGTIVWEWHVWDHLIQDFDITKDNYGVVIDHPELVDINYDTQFGAEDWTHANGIDYNPELDQIALSVRHFNEFWVIDHSTTTAEAASHSGGNSNMGGDLVYRWGNPQAYRRGLPADQKLFFQHDIQWIEPGRPGAGNFVVFNNGPNAAGVEGNVSSADEIASPVDEDGLYPIDPGMPFGPVAPVWSYMGDPPDTFWSAVMSGVQRLPNGNTLMCEAVKGKLTEVTPDKEVVWVYVNPLTPAGPLTQGDPIGGGFIQDNSVFQVRRFESDFPGFDGKDLTPGAPIEIFDAPFAVPTPSVLLAKAEEEQVEVDWDASSCTSFDYDLLYGDLSQVATHDLVGADCSIGTSGVHVWTPPVSPSSLFLLVVGHDATGIYESSWGSDSSGLERNGSNASASCGATTKLIASACP